MYPYAVVLTGMQINEPFQTSVLMQAKCEKKKKLKMRGKITPHPWTPGKAGLKSIAWKKCVCAI